MNNRKIRVAISHGDINGINYEILLKTFADDRILELFTPVVYGSGKALAYWRNALSIEGNNWHQIQHAGEAREGAVNLIDCTGGQLLVEPGRATETTGEAALTALEAAVCDVQAGRMDVLVTAPINKSVMPQDRFPFAGHTQYLESVAAMEPGKSLMLLTSDGCRVALTTGHIPVAQVAQAISIDLIVQKVETLVSGLKRDFGIAKPRIAILALNPHAGDRGLIGSEEQNIIIPAIERLEAEGHLVFGPYPADAFWASGKADSFDAVLAMYHDQGLAPFKSLHMNEGVNTTLGLSFVRTSPDHGTGYDIAGLGIASADSIRNAMYQAVDIWRTRQQYDHATRNPLRRTYHNRGRDDERFELNGDADGY